MKTKIAILSLLSCSALLSPSLVLAEHGREASVQKDKFTETQARMYSSRLKTFAVKTVAKPLASEFLGLNSVQKIIGGRSDISALLAKGLINLTRQVGKQLQKDGSVRVQPGLVSASSFNHAGYVAGDVLRPMGIPEGKARTAIFDVVEQIRAGKLAAPNDAKSQLQVAKILQKKLGPLAPHDIKTQTSMLKTLLDPNGSWMFGAWYGPMTAALNVTGLLATRELIKLATALGGSEKAGIDMLKKVATMSPKAFTKAVKKPQGQLGLLAAATVLFNKAGYQTSKYVQGGSALLKGKTADGMKRMNDHLTNLGYTGLVGAPDAHIQLPKDQTQLSSGLAFMGLL